MHGVQTHTFTRIGNLPTLSHPWKSGGGRLGCGGLQGCICESATTTSQIPSHRPPRLIQPGPQTRGDTWCTRWPADLRSHLEPAGSLTASTGSLGCRGVRFVNPSQVFLRCPSSMTRETVLWDIGVRTVSLATVQFGSDAAVAGHVEVVQNAIDWRYAVSTRPQHLAAEAANPLIRIHQRQKLGQPFLLFAMSPCPQIRSRQNGSTARVRIQTSCSRLKPRCQPGRYRRSFRVNCTSRKLSAVRHVMRRAEMRHGMWTYLAACCHRLPLRCCGLAGWCDIRPSVGYGWRGWETCWPAVGYLWFCPTHVLLLRG
ncbi:hypothetical protein BT67DRAFT_7014 [Trichocladium antarcticum]|uniref:Uncharacterized protein n=1 Tax=Trichocladium antarcticum TaxID=1450529 RepID=A0AAN6UV06_9PEZI|nr:hypothetical protein BT67DRAFT_7014 [Trichocladium antarcticum]